MHRLQYISQGNTGAEHLQNIQSTLEAGVRFIQLRLKNVTEEDYLDCALKAAELCKKFDADLVINDSPFVAEKCNAIALHLGLDDMNVKDAKEIFKGKIIGGTANTLEHVIQRSHEGVNYIGLGPFRFTNTKEKLSPILGTEGYKSIVSEMKKRNIDLPVYAIGGIEMEDIEKIIKTGVYGIAVSGMLTRATDKKKTVEQINKILEHA
ncbi:MAG TPA: thiamine phosphate synthase [Bacteroidia bacterium]|nr:thiamine phosphate synthase [Bacteroidia bacterium]